MTIILHQLTFEMDSLWGDMSRPCGLKCQFVLRGYSSLSEMIIILLQLTFQMDSLWGDMSRPCGLKCQFVCGVIHYVNMHVALLRIILCY